MPRHRTQPTRWAFAPVLACLVSLAARSTPLAHAESAEARGAALADVRAFAGTINGLGAELWILEGRLRLDATGGYSFSRMGWAGLGLELPFWSFASGFVGARLGYQLEHLGQDGAYWRGSRFAQAPDAGLVLHVESARGNTFEAQVGGEAVFREQRTICCDNAGLETRSFGARVLLRSELGLGPTWALFGELGVRTGDHVMEIKVLPSAMVGVRARF